MLIGVFNVKIKEIIEEREKQENIKKEKEKHIQEQKNKLRSIIKNVKGARGVFDEARKTLPYFSNREKLNIIQELSPGIANLLNNTFETELDKPESREIIDNALIDILHTKYDKA